MGRTERGERPFYHALAALVFAAACAWSAAALYGGASRIEAPAATPEPVPAAAPARVRGVLLRREDALPAGAYPDTAPGERLPASVTGAGSALFFRSLDGWEFLTPDDASRLAPDRLEALLRSPPAEKEGARLVYGFTIDCAALFEGDAPPTPGPCTLKLDGVGEAKGRVLAVSTDALGRTTLRLRLTSFPETLYELRVIAGEIGS